MSLGPIQSMPATLAAAQRARQQMMESRLREEKEMTRLQMEEEFTAKNKHTDELELEKVQDRGGPPGPQEAAPSQLGQTALCEAAAAGDLPGCKRLAVADALLVTQPTNNGRTPLR